MTFDPYTNRVPFGLLTPEEQQVLRGCDAPWEYWGDNTWWPAGNPLWAESGVYRAVRPADAAPSPAPADDRDLTIRAALAAWGGIWGNAEFNCMNAKESAQTAFDAAEAFVAEARKRGLV